MKAKLVLDQHCDIVAAAKLGYLDKVRNLPAKDRAKGIGLYPEGTEFEGDHALFLVGTGQAHPSDGECMQACGKPVHELRAMQAAYKLTHDGYSKQEDRDLALAGVITGYDKDGKPIPGPNWDQYQAKVAEEKASDEI